MTRNGLAHNWSARQDAILVREWSNPHCSTPKIAEMVGFDTKVVEYRGRVTLKLGPKARPASIWNEGNCNLLRTLWADRSLGCTAMGHRFGVSKNAVITQAQRMGLPSRQMKPGPKRQANPPKAAKPKLIICGSSTVMHAAEAQPSPAPPIKAKAWEPLPGVAPISRAEATPRHCAWPITVDGDELSHCCGAVATDGAYCASHHRLSHASTQPAKLTAKSLRRWAA